MIRGSPAPQTNRPTKLDHYKRIVIEQYDPSTQLWDIPFNCHRTGQLQPDIIQLDMNRTPLFKSSQGFKFIGSQYSPKNTHIVHKHHVLEIDTSYILQINECGLEHLHKFILVLTAIGIPGSVSFCGHVYSGISMDFDRLIYVIYDKDTHPYDRIILKQKRFKMKQIIWKTI